jgi:hypothetical protein
MPTSFGAYLLLYSNRILHSQMDTGCLGASTSEEKMPSSVAAYVAFAVVILQHRIPYLWTASVERPDAARGRRRQRFSRLLTFLLYSMTFHRRDGVHQPNPSTSASQCVRPALLLPPFTKLIPTDRWMALLAGRNLGIITERTTDQPEQLS